MGTTSSEEVLDFAQFSIERSILDLIGFQIECQSCVTIRDVLSRLNDDQ